MRVIMPAIIDQAGRQFNVDETDGVSRRHTLYVSMGSYGFAVRMLSQRVNITPLLACTATSRTMPMPGT